jgi:hypothetical protein
LSHAQVAAITAGIAAVIGVGLRCAPGLAADFPLNDGGLLAATIADMQRPGIPLPVMSSYNGATPITIPPLALYLAAALHHYLDANIPDLLRFIPMLFAVGTLPAFWLLSRQLIRSSAGATVAFTTFAVLPAGFASLLGGGGLSRSPGFFFALLALWKAAATYQVGGVNRTVATSVLVGLTILIDLQATTFLLIGLSCLFLTLGRDRTGLMTTALIGIGAMVVAAPWWLPVALASGPGPLLTVPGAGAFVMSALRPTPPFNAIAAAAALLGLVLSATLLLVGGVGFPLGWLLAVALLDTAQVVSHSTPAVCIGIGLVTARFTAVRESPRAVTQINLAAPFWLRVPLAELGALAIFVGFIIVVYLNRLPEQRAAMLPLVPEERTAMVAAAQQAGPAAAFLVLSGDRWEVDRAGDWFPALTGGRNVISPVLVAPPPGMPQRIPPEAHARAQACGTQDGSCLDRWEREFRIDFSHVFIARRSSRNCCDHLRAALRAHPGFVLLYDGPGATVFVRNQ